MKQPARRRRPAAPSTQKSTTCLAQRRPCHTPFNTTSARHGVRDLRGVETGRLRAAHRVRNGAVVLAKRVRQLVEVLVVPGGVEPVAVRALRGHVVCCIRRKLLHRCAVRSMVRHGVRLCRLWRQARLAWFVLRRRSWSSVAVVSLLHAACGAPADPSRLLRVPINLAYRHRAYRHRAMSRTGC